MRAETWLQLGKGSLPTEPKGTRASIRHFTLCPLQRGQRPLLKVPNRLAFPDPGMLTD